MGNANDNVEVLFNIKHISPEQVLLDTLNAVREDGAVEKLCVVYQDKDGYFRSCITNMKTADLFFFGEIIQSRARRDGLL